MAGVAMPFAGKVIAASIAQFNPTAGLNTITMAVNRVSASGYDVALNATGTLTESAIADFSAAPLSFAAGDMLAMKVTQSSDTNNTTVGAFFVIFN